MRPNRAALVLLYLVCFSSGLRSAAGDAGPSRLSDDYDPGDEAIPNQSDVSSIAGWAKTPQEVREGKAFDGRHALFSSYKALRFDPAKDERTIRLGPASSIHLSNPAVADVRLISSVYNEGPATMTRLDVYSLYPETQDRQEILDIDFYPTDGQLIQDDRGQNVVHWHFEGIAPQAEGLTYWQARIRTWEMRYDIADEDVGSLADVPRQIADEFLADDELFQIHHPTIISAVGEAVGRTRHPLHMAEQIFYWVKEHLDYAAGGGWDDAPTVIERGNGSCSEYAYAFIAMCRSAGIPARWTGSIVRRGAQDGPGPYRDGPKHRWAEIYLPRIGWMHCNVNGGTWGCLPNRYLVVSQSSGPSNYLKTRYDSYRQWSFGGDEGSVSKLRYGLWYAHPNSFYALHTDSGDWLWDSKRSCTLYWDPLGQGTPADQLTIEVIHQGQMIWQVSGLDPMRKTATIPVAEIAPAGSELDLHLYETDRPDIGAYVSGIQVKPVTDPPVSGGLDADLLAQWPFDEGTGNWTRDMIGGQYAIVQGAVWDEGVIDKALYFDGYGDAVITPLTIDQGERTSGATFCAWVCPTDISPGRHHVISSDNGDFDWSLLRERDAWYVFTGEGSRETPYWVDSAHWQFVAAVFIPGGGIRFHKNNLMAVLNDIDMDASCNPIAIGDNPGPWDEAFAGRIDEVRVYSRPLNSQEILHIYHQGLKQAGQPDSGVAGALPRNRRR